MDETVVDKIRKYHTDYNNNPPSCVAFMVSTSGRLHGEFVVLLFLQAHRETNLFTTSGVQVAQSTSGQFHFKCVVFSSQLKSKVGNILTNAAALRITLNIDGEPVVSDTTGSDHTLTHHKRKVLVY